jgi:hypothetical protein
MRRFSIGPYCLSFAGCAGLIACHASLDAKVGGQASAKEDSQSVQYSSSTPTTDSADTLDAPPALLGARGNLRLKNPGTETCSCVGVAVGAPSSSLFVWDGPASRVNASTQLAVSLGSENVPCAAAPADSLGASYWGYEVTERDVVVVVETARLGRPIVTGAIIPRPSAGGRVLIRPLDSKTPYGRNKTGTTECVVWTNSDTPDSGS